MAQKVRRVDYCQFLLSSQINDTLTYFADHHLGFSHDAINRYLKRDKMSPFDDTVADKNYSHCIELVRRQWS